MQIKAIENVDLQAMRIMVGMDSDDSGFIEFEEFQVPSLLLSSLELSDAKVYEP